MSRRITQRRRRARRRKRRDRRRRDKAALVESNPRRPRLRLLPGPLEVARGHDGLLRGYPEPVLVVAVYQARGDSCRLLTRTVARYQRIRELPCVVAPRDRGGVKGVRLPAGDRIVVIAVALEEDSSRDIQRLYGELAECDGIVAWPSAGDGIPGTLEQLPEALDAESFAAVELKVAGHFPADWFGADDYISAAATWLEAVARRSVELEIPARSADGRNDWRARVTIRFG